MKRIAGEVLGAADTEFKEVCGLTLTQLIGLFEHLVRRVESRVNDHREQMHAVFGAGDPTAIGRELGRRFANVRGISELQGFFANAAGMQRREAQFLVVMALEGVLPGYLVFGAEATSEELGLDQTSVSSVLKRLSQSFGQLHERTPESFLLNNPVWMQPLIELQEGVFFCALPQSLMSFVFHIVDVLAHPHAACSIALTARSRHVLSFRDDLTPQ